MSLLRALYVAAPPISSFARRSLRPQPTRGISLTNRHGRTRDLIISHLQRIVAQHLLKRG
jgi:hypothetical protein